MECVGELQEFFTYAGYYANTFLRAAARDIERSFREKNRIARIKCLAAAIFALPFAAVLLLPSLACYTFAALIGKGRFKYIASKEEICWQKGQRIKVMALNACLQDPWSTLTGGVVTPFERIGVHQSRVAAIVECIVEKDPDIFLGQEFEDLGAQRECVRLLKEKGFTHFIMDLGSDRPIRNSSGLFVASKIALFAIKFTPFPWADREGLAKGSGQGALSFALTKGANSPRLVNTHLNYGGPECQAARERQLKNHIGVLLKNCPAVLFGDLNCHTAAITPERWKELGLGGFRNALENKITCTDAGKHALLGKKKPESSACVECEESIDGIIYHSDVVTVVQTTTEVLRCGDQYLSDHYAAVATLEFP